jgi:adenylyl-sulfate kinase
MQPLITPPSILPTAATPALQQKPAVLWFTGLSGAGKSTLAQAVQVQLQALGLRCYLLDGDKLRQGLNQGLGFSAADRAENVRRVGEVAALMADAGLIVLVALISPFRADRLLARSKVAAGEFFEIFVDAPLAVVEQRDTKGLYRLARSGQLKDFTGIDSPYEAPLQAELHIDSAGLTVDAAAMRVLKLLLLNR